MGKYVLHCEKPIAADSPDHLAPRGTANDNSRNRLFNRKLQALLGNRKFRVLDLGCAGGGFVKDWLDDGHSAIGLEGSDYSQKLRRAEWATIPDHLFTCDITRDFRITRADSGDESPELFDAITGWEFLEHIKAEDLPAVLAGANKHLAPGGMLIFSVADFQDVDRGIAYHQTVRPMSWWVERFATLGFRHQPQLVKYFDPDWVRGPMQGSNSFHLILTRESEVMPAVPTGPTLSADDFFSTGKAFLEQGVAGQNVGGAQGNIEYSVICFDRSLAHRDQPDVRAAKIRAMAYLRRTPEAREAVEGAMIAFPDHAEIQSLAAALAARPQATLSRRPKFSVITPSYNCGPFIDRMIQSVLLQNYENFEHIVMDGGSKDQTLDVLRKYPHLRWTSEPDKGEGDALNKALALATGDIILWLNADDWIEPGAFHRVAAEMDIDAGIHCVFGKTDMVDGEGRFLWLKKSEPAMNLPLLLRWWANGQHPHQPSCYYSRKMVQDLGPFNSALHYSIDYEYWLRIMVRYGFRYVDMTLSAMRNRDDSKSITSVPGQIASHWRVGLPYHQYLTADQRFAFWADYYAFLFSNGPHSVFGDQVVIPPTTREAQLALAAILQKIPDANKAQLFAGWVAERSDEPASRELGRLARSSVVAPSTPAGLRKPADAGARPVVVVDGVFFQFYATGIARVWNCLLNQWKADGFAPHLIVLDRGGTMPKFDGVRYRTVAPYDYDNAEADRRMLQRVCDEEGAAAFISTYYTTPVNTPSVFMAHDMIPELFGWDLRSPMWREKHFGIRHASAFVCVSESTRRDLLRFFPELPPEKVYATPLAAAAAFFPRPEAEIAALRAAAGVRRPYFLTVGARGGYKNTILTFRGLGGFKELDQFDLLCAGQITLEPEYQQWIGAKEARAFNLTDDQLAAAYSGAIALLHPSSYEGFGLPVLEAMACGCPVITTKNGSLAEVAGDAAIYVGADDVAGMTAALSEVQKPEVRQRLIDAGLERARQFSWAKTAGQIRGVLEAVAQAAHT